MLRHVCSTVLAVLCTMPAGAAWPASTHIPDLPALAAAHAEGLAALNSDGDASAFFSSHLESALGLSAPRDAGGKTRSHTKPAPQVSPARETIELGGQLTAELAAWRLAHAVEQASRAPDPKSLSTALAESDKQASWLTRDGQRPALALTWRRAAAAMLFPERPSEVPAQPGYTDYADDLDRQVAQAPDTDGFWLNLVDRDGAEGLRRVLRSFWDRSGERGAIPEEDMHAYAARYVHARLRPLLRASVEAAAARAESEAERQARESWDELRTAAERARRRKGLARLCGTWQWTVHNHQNHVDHKSVMVFASPDSPNGSIQAPAQTVVLGDVVYLRWEFQGGGFQEDSLLFTGEGRRLEGTFITSSGAWGSITGKRTGVCQP